MVDLALASGLKWGLRSRENGEKYGLLSVGVKSCNRSYLQQRGWRLYWQAVRSQQSLQ